MTNLTEKWRKGELPSGWYWVEGSRAEGIYAYNAEYLNNMYRPRNGERIIEKVPSYDEYEALLSDQLAKNEGVEINTELEAQNTKLKELLMSARNYLKSYRDLYSKDNEDIVDFIKEIDQVLADNKIQANTVACNKIQESE